MDAEKQVMRPGLLGWAQGEAGEGATRPPACPPTVLLSLEGTRRHRGLLSESTGEVAERNPPPLK